MYGIFAGAIVFSAAIMQLFKSGKIKDQFGHPIQPKIKKEGVPYLINWLDQSICQAAVSNQVVVVDPPLERFLLHFVN